MINRVMEAMKPHVKHRIWIFSDLQQSLPERATYCMTRAVADFVELQLPVEHIVYLGDAVEGYRPEFLADMIDMQMSELSKVDAPVYYCVGNHDFDYFRYHHEHEKTLDHMEIPFREAALKHPQWHTAANLEDMYFTVDCGDFMLFILTDHAAKDGSWFTTHGEVRGDASAYPYTEADYHALRSKIARCGKPVITLSHYAYAGGNRPAPLFDQLLPVPSNVRMHFYGHAHIGDAVWAGKDCYRKISAVDQQPLVQINVASLENFRGTAIRSAVMEWYDDDSIGVYFRNHTERCWDDVFMTRKGAQICKEDLDQGV